MGVTQRAANDLRQILKTAELRYSSETHIDVCFFRTHMPFGLVWLLTWSQNAGDLHTGTTPQPATEDLHNSVQYVVDVHVCGVPQGCRPWFGIGWRATAAGNVGNHGADHLASLEHH